MSNANNNDTVTMQPGQELRISLKADPGFDPWRKPSSTDTSVLAPIADTRATAPQGTTLASFRALKTGTAKLNADAIVHCDVPPNSPGACPFVAHGWSITVHVS